MDVKNQIAPKGLEYKPAGLVISDKHATILTVVSYPKYISPGYLSSLTSTPASRSSAALPARHRKR